MNASPPPPLDWQDAAACRSADPDLFFTDDGWRERAVCLEIGGDLWFPGKGEANEPAKKLCRSCEVRLPCLAFALRRAEWGIWGGFSAEQRETIRRQHLAGRSLADIIAADDAAFYGRIERAA